MHKALGLSPQNEGRKGRREAFLSQCHPRPHRQPGGRKTLFSTDFQSRWWLGQCACRCTLAPAGIPGSASAESDWGSGDSWESDLGIWGQKKKSILSTKAQMGWILPKVLHNPWFVYFLSDSLRWETVFIGSERRGLHRPGLGIRSPMAGGSFRPVLEDNLLFRKKLYIWFKPMF